MFGHSRVSCLCQWIYSFQVHFYVLCLLFYFNTFIRNELFSLSLSFPPPCSTGSLKLQLYCYVIDCYWNLCFSCIVNILVVEPYPFIPICFIILEEAESPSESIQLHKFKSYFLCFESYLSYIFWSFIITRHGQISQRWADSLSHGLEEGE